MSSPISLIITTYNRERYLSRAIASILDLSRNLKALRRAEFSDYSSWLNSDEIHDSIRV
jgi:glycosyltransferase involved in cell wall biosynthesis